MSLNMNYTIILIQIFSIHGYKQKQKPASSTNKSCKLMDKNINYYTSSGKDRIFDKDSSGSAVTLLLKTATSLLAIRS